MAPQHPQRTGPSTVNSKQDASLPVRSQNTAIIPADQQESGPSSPPLRGIAANAVGGTESRTRSSATPQELWSRVQAGNINAALALADLYTRGEGVTANCTQARLLLQMASKKGSAEAGRRLQKLDASSCAASSSEDSKPN